GSQSPVQLGLCVPGARSGPAGRPTAGDGECPAIGPGKTTGAKWRLFATRMDRGCGPSSLQLSPICANPLIYLSLKPSNAAKRKTVPTAGKFVAQLGGNLCNCIESCAEMQ